MSKKTKKRNKPYRGDDAANRQPVVHHYTAKTRSPAGEWWVEHKRRFKIGGIITAIIFVLVFLIFELLRWIF